MKAKFASDLIKIQPGNTTQLPKLREIIAYSLKQEVQEIFDSAVITVIWFAIGKFLIGLYIGKSAITSGFGAAGSLIAQLVWVNYAAQVFLLHTEFTWAYSNIYGLCKNVTKIKDS